MYTTDPYIVITHREDGKWNHTIELKGEMMRLPGKVIDRVIAQREAIIKEQRSDRGKERSEQLKATAQADQELAADQDRERDLGGL